MKYLKQLTILLIFCFLLNSVSFASVSNTEDYLKNKLSNSTEPSEWLTLALFNSNNSYSGLLKNHLSDYEVQIKKNGFDTTSTLDYAKAVLLVTSGGKNPNSFGGIDFIKAIKNCQLKSGKFANTIDKKGDTLINAHIWAIISLYSANEKIPNQEQAYAWLASAMNKDGGYGFIKGAKSDTDMSAMALIAYKCLGKSINDKSVLKTLNYIKSNQLSSGGFSSMGIENLESSAIVLQAMVINNLNPLKELPKGDIIKAILSYKLNDGTYCHILNGDSNDMSTVSAYTSLKDYYNKKSIYKKLKEMKRG